MQGSARIDELRQKFHENPRRYFAPLANEYRKAGDPEQAIAICRAHLAQQPGHMSGHVVYGQALYDAKRIDESRTVFEKALTLDPDNAIVLRYLGDIARQRGETAEAKHWYGRAFDADPNNSEIAAYIAELTEPLTETAEPVTEPAAPVADATAEAVPETIELVETSAVDSNVGSVEEVAIVEQVPPTADRDELVESTARDSLDVSDTDADEEVSTAPADVEVAETVLAEESAEEPAAAPSEQLERARSDTPVATPIVPLADVSWRKTPPHEDSPFVTRTMAELYAKQGYKAAALDVYKQLSLINPDDQEIFARIRELSGAESTSRDVEAEVESSPVAELADAEDAPREESEPASLADEVPGEIGAESSTEAEPDREEAIPVVDMSLAVPSRVEELAAAAPPDWTEVSEEPVYTPAVVEIEPEAKPSTSSSDRHFTELDLAAGDTWDTDTWGAGFSADESTDIELDIPDSPVVNLSSAQGETSPQDAAQPSEPAATAAEASASPETAPEPTGTAAPTDWERAATDAAATAEQTEPAAAEAEPAVAEAEPAVAEAEPVSADVQSAPTAAAPVAAEEEQSAQEEVEPEPAQPEPAIAEVAVAEERGTAVPETTATIAEEKPATEAVAVPEEPTAEPRSANEDFVEAERFAAAESEPAAVADPDFEPEKHEAEPEREAEAAPEDGRNARPTRIAKTSRTSLHTRHSRRPTKTFRTTSRQARQSASSSQHSAHDDRPLTNRVNHSPPAPRFRRTRILRIIHSQRARSPISSPIHRSRKRILAQHSR